MLISHSRRFILVKSRKTASTSLERAIIPHLGPEDVWTPISLPQTRGQNYYSRWPVDWLTARSSRFRDWAGKEHWLHHRYFYDHIPLSRITRMICPERTAGYRKYAFDRNPWDYMVSYYFYRRRKGSFAGWDFDRFLHEYPVERNWDLYTSNGRMLADKVFRFEELPQAVQQIESETGLQIGQLPADKSHYRDDRSYRSFYDAASRDLVAARFRETIALLGYAF